LLCFRQALNHLVDTSVLKLSQPTKLSVEKHINRFLTEVHYNSTHQQQEVAFRPPLVHPPHLRDLPKQTAIQQLVACFA
jgi:hypothetical protein